MSQWKNTDTNVANSIPIYVDRDPHINRLNVIANNAGWLHRMTYTDMHSKSRQKDEILVAIRGLAGNNASGSSTKLGAATITDVRWSSATAGLNAVANVIVTFNEEVVVSGIPTLSFTVANNTTSGGNTVLLDSTTASYVSGSGTNRLRFNMTTQSNTATYTINHGTITSNSTVFILDKQTPQLASDMTIPDEYTGANSAVGVLTASGT